MIARPKGWRGESERHRLAAMGIPSKPSEVRLRESTKTGRRTLARLQILADTLWYDKGFLSPEQREDVKKEMVDIQKVLGEYRWDAGGQLRRVRRGERGLFTEWEETSRLIERALA